MDDEVVITGLNRVVIYSWIFISIMMPVYALYKDFTGPGLTGTIFFSVLGYLTYPVFYGSCAFIIYRMIFLLNISQTYMVSTGNKLKIGNCTVSISNVDSVRIRRNRLFIKELVINLNNGNREIIRAYIMSESPHKVLRDIELLIQRT